MPNNARWKPDDSFHDLIDGEYKGVRRVRQVLESLKLELGREIVTSRDPKIRKVVERLRRDTLPNGFQQWQLPIILGGGDRPVMSFLTVGAPNTVLPVHRHKNDCLFRIVLSGSIMFGKVELSSGDWMYIPTGKSYSFAAGPFGCVVMHLYNGSGLYRRAIRPH